MLKKLKMEYCGRDYGICGKKAPFKDSNGDNLYVGDVVRLIDKTINDDHGPHVIVENEKEVFVMGIRGECPCYQQEWYIYKDKSYMSMKDGDEVDMVCYKKYEDKKEMTISQIEKELGYSIKIVKE